MQAVILAAGKGARLKELTAHRPKPMIPVAGKPCLEWIITGLHEAGIRQLAVVTGYCADALESYFEDGTKWDVSIRYVRQTVQDGTGGALRVAQSLVGNDPFLMTYGDILVHLDNYRRILDAHIHHPSGGVLGLNWVLDPCQGGAVYLGEDNRVERIIEKPPQGASTTHWNNAGLMVFGTEIWPYIQSLPLSKRGEYELPSAIERLINDGGDVIGLPLEGLWGDIGTPEELDDISMRIGNGDWTERRTS